MKYNYYGIKGDRVWKLSWYNPIELGSYSQNHLPRFIRESERVWLQGPRGGVKIIKDSTGTSYWGRYLRRDSEAMKEFVWIKLRAIQLG
jgi:hypothetical protein